MNIIYMDTLDAVMFKDSKMTRREVTLQKVRMYLFLTRLSSGGFRQHDKFRASYLLSA